MRLNAQVIGDYVSGQLKSTPNNANLEATGLTWDSREVVPGDVYVALPGNRVDGHDFVPRALEAGAAVVLVSSELSADVYEDASSRGTYVYKVADTYQAVTDLAAHWRSHLKGTVIALTGSVGKTTTKNLVRDILSTTFTTVATHANQNNELGVPKTLLQAEADTQMVVVEMGMRGSGQLASLCEFVKPDIALVTNCGECHIELLGSREAIARAKAEAVAALPEGGKAVLNLADERFGLVCEAGQVNEKSIEVLGFDGTGASKGAYAWASELSLDESGRPHFVLHLPDGAHKASMELRGAHNVSNACAAAALAYSVGVPAGSIVSALKTSLPELGRQEILSGRGGITVVNDAYNANPDSMKASLSMFCAMDVAGRRVAVLGDMGELGSFAEACHRSVGAFLAPLPVSKLLCIGELSRFIASAAVEQGYPESDTACFATREEALSYLESFLEPGDAVLCKASHSMELDKIAKELTA